MATTTKADEKRWQTQLEKARIGKLSLGELQTFQQESFNAGKVYESLEVSNIAIDQLKQEKDAHRQTLDKVDELSTKLSQAECGMSQDEIEAEKEMEEVFNKKHATLTGSYDKVSNHIERIQTQISEGVATQKLKNDLLIETSKMGALMESLQDASKDKLKAAKAKAEKLSDKLASVRELWKVATEDVTNAQAEYDKYVSKIQQVCTGLVLEVQICMLDDASINV